MGEIQAVNEVCAKYAPVTPKGCLIMGVAVPNNENWSNPLPAAGCGEDLGWSPADTEPRVPSPDRTILKQIDLSGCASWSLEDHREAANWYQSLQVCSSDMIWI